MAFKKTSKATIVNAEIYNEISEDLQEQTPENNTEVVTSLHSTNLVNNSSEDETREQD